MINHTGDLLRYKNIADDDKIIHFSAPPPRTRLTLADAMTLAIEAARLGTGWVTPNPLVGAVILDRNGEFLGYGAHRQVGEAHAEVNAVNQVIATHGTEALQGATLVCTLEPCSHVGRTPSCARMLTQHPWERVVYAMVDPSPQVNGKGIRILEDGGIPCFQLDEFATEASEVSEFFIHQKTHQRPFIGIKTAISLDGAIAFSGDERHWLTDERARLYGHYLRLRYDAIVVGKNTFIQDKPLLTMRYTGLRSRQPHRIVLDPSGDLATSAHSQNPAFFARQPAASFEPQIFWVMGESADTDSHHHLLNLGVRILKVPHSKITNLSFDIAFLVQQLSEHGIQSILLEGGAGVYGSFLDAGFVDKLHLFQCPRLLGGAGRLLWAKDVQQRLNTELTDMTLTPLARDWVIEGRLRDRR